MSARPWPDLLEKVSTNLAMQSTGHKEAGRQEMAEITSAAVGRLRALSQQSQAELDAIESATDAGWILDTMGAALQGHLPEISGYMSKGEAAGYPTEVLVGAHVAATVIQVTGMKAEWRPK